ncbi:MAG: sulfatase [Alphaproteobacteria bacterium]|nr:sulfatase [Alphaproteobacteria bacterium]
MFTRKALAHTIALLAATLAIGAGSAHAAQRPNIILMLSDDQTWLDIGPYGSKNVPTPNLDRLAREGMKFNLAFTATAMCAPTRQQLYTGLFPARSGGMPNHSVVREGTKSLVHYFTALGYRVGLTGKTHFGPPESFPFEVVGNKKSGTFTLVDLDAARAFIERDAEQPFFLVVASNSPHTPWTEGNAADFDPAKLEVLPYIADTPEVREMLTHYYAEITHLDGQAGALMGMLDEAGLTENTIFIHTSEQGNSFPKSKWTLYDTGIHTGLIFRWPGHVAPGTQTDAMVQYVDVVPTLIEAAGGTPGDVDGKSFLAVLEGKAGEHREYAYGIHTNRGVIDGTDYPIRSIRTKQYKLIHNLMWEGEYGNILTGPQSSGILDAYRAAAGSGNEHAGDLIAGYIKRPEFELYDVQKDPFEFTNLADDPAYATVKAELLAKLEAWMKEQGDEGVATELDAYNHMNPEVVKVLEEKYGQIVPKKDGE